VNPMSVPAFSRSPVADAVVVLVQPHDDNRDMYAEFFRLHGVAVLAFADAEDALRVAQLASVVVTDVHRVGNLNGIALLERLRQDERTSDVPVLVVTASPLPSDRVRAEAAGCNMFLTMPCVPDELLRAVRRVLLARSNPKPDTVN
jgi:CheY-like chemotaxis protein